MAVVCFVGSVWELAHKQWQVAGSEFLLCLLCLSMAWLGLKLLDVINRLFNAIEAKFQ